MTTNKGIIRLALMLGLFSSLGPFTIDMYLPAFPEIMLQLNSSNSLVQFSLTACLLGLALGQLVIGSLSDVHGRKRILLYSMGLYIIFSIACALATHISLLISFRFVQGFAAAAGIVISRAIARDLYSGRELTQFFSLLVLVGNIGPLVAPVSGSGILTFASWAGVFFFLALLGSLLWIMTKWGLTETLPPERRTPSNLAQQIRNYGLLLSNRLFLGYILTQGIMVAGVFAYVAGTPFIYQNIYGVSPTTFALLFSSNGISLIIGSQIVGRMAKRVEMTLFVKLGLILSILSSVAVLTSSLLQGPLFTLVLPLFFFVGSIGMTSTAVFSLAMEGQARIAGSAAALLGVVPYLLGALTAPLVGISDEKTAMPLALIILVSSTLASLAYYLLARPKERGAEQAVLNTTL